MRRRIGDAELEIKEGDLTAEAADAIVNAANPTLLGGGGVDGAIHRKGGPEILAACREERRRLGRLLGTGEAVITTGGALAAAHVIHTVGPIFGSDPDPDGSLARCYRASLALAAGHRLRSIAFPSISTGAYGFPIERAASVALAALGEALEPGLPPIERVTMVLFDREAFETYRAVLARLRPV